MENGKLVLSLDFELLWGIFDKVDPEESKEYFERTRGLIPKILALFKKHEISCTWAVVGMLFNRDWEEWEQNIPENLPSYRNRELDPYEFGKSVREKGLVHTCFAPELIEQIINTPGQEIATHTYSHYYCSEPGQTTTEFKKDIEKAIAIAKGYGIVIRSLVFPRNQLNESYLSVCRELGIKSVRSNPSDWYWQETEQPSLLKKIFRTGDAYLGVNNKSYSFSEMQKNYEVPLQQKASRLLRPCSHHGLLNDLRLRRIKSEMTSAARNREVYHLWWHPHNFARNPEQSLAELEQLLDHYLFLKRKYEYQSYNMEMIENQLRNQQKNKSF